VLRLLVIAIIYTLNCPQLPCKQEHTELTQTGFQVYISGPAEANFFWSGHGKNFRGQWMQRRS